MQSDEDQSYKHHDDIRHRVAAYQSEQADDEHRSQIDSKTYQHLHIVAVDARLARKLGVERHGLLVVYRQLEDGEVLEACGEHAVGYQHQQAPFADYHLWQHQQERP